MVCPADLQLQGSSRRAQRVAARRYSSERSGPLGSSSGGREPERSLSLCAQIQPERANRFSADHSAILQQRAPMTAITHFSMAGARASPISTTQPTRSPASYSLEKPRYSCLVPAAGAACCKGFPHLPPGKSGTTQFPTLVHLLREDSKQSAGGGKAHHHVRVHTGQARSFVATSSEASRYHVQIPLLKIVQSRGGDARASAKPTSTRWSSSTVPSAPAT